MALRRGLPATRIGWTKGQYHPNASASTVVPWIVVATVRVNMPSRQYSPSLTLGLRASAGSSRDLVAHAERLALADLQTSLDIAALCRALAVSERTLRKAFQKVHKLPPCRRLRWLRLSHARRALMSVGGSSVTEIATGLGFVELGRFSVEYRKIFGERPSETLRQAMQNRHGVAADQRT